MVAVAAIGRPNFTWSPASYQPPVRSRPTSAPSCSPESPRQLTRLVGGQVAGALRLVEEQRLLQGLAVVERLCEELRREQRRDTPREPGRARMTHWPCCPPDAHELANLSAALDLTTSRRSARMPWRATSTGVRVFVEFGERFRGRGRTSVITRNGVIHVPCPLKTGGVSPLPPRDASLCRIVSRESPRVSARQMRHAGQGCQSRCPLQANADRLASITRAVA